MIQQQSLNMSINNIVGNQYYIGIQHHGLLIYMLEYKMNEIINYLSNVVKILPLDFFVLKKYRHRPQTVRGFQNTTAWLPLASTKHVSSVALHNSVILWSSIVYVLWTNMVYYSSAILTVYCVGMLDIL